MIALRASYDTLRVVMILAKARSYERLCRVLNGTGNHIITCHRQNHSSKLIFRCSIYFMGILCYNVLALKQPSECKQENNNGKR